MIRGRFTGAVVVGALAVVAIVGPAQASARANSSPSIDPKPVGVAVLVDESGSLQDAGVAAERTAVQTIVQADPATDSHIAVVGFGGRNGGPGQTPVDVVCQPTVVDVSPNTDYLAQCTQNLARRTEAQGDDTDFPSALREGVSLLGQMKGVTAKMIFILTDGRMDVRRDPAYGPDADSRQASGVTQLNSVLKNARGQGVAIWPLGFNQAVRSDLDALAAGGAQGSSGCGSPVARMASSVDDVVTTLINAFAAARCDGVGQSAPEPAPADLTVTIPPVATNGAIAVNKGDPALQVTFVDPNNVSVTQSGTQDGSEFQLSGENSAVEVLRIRDPVQGKWHVKVSAPQDGQSHTVSATVLWQGAVQSSLVLDPPSPRPGQPASVQLTLATRRGPLTDQSALSGIQAGAVLSGHGFNPVTIPLTPGTGGEFTGNLTMPASGTGAFQLVGQVSGVGISDDRRPLESAFSSGPITVTAQFSFASTTVQPGGTVDGTISFQNNTSSSYPFKLSLADVHGLLTLSKSSGVIQQGAGQFAFQVRVDPRSQLSAARGTVVVTDAKTGVRYADSDVDIDVTYPPPWALQYWWVFVLAAAIVLACIGALVLRRRHTNEATDVSKLAAKLLTDNDRTVFNLRAPQQRDDEFRFAIDVDSTPPMLRYGTAGEPAVRVRRAGPLLVSIAVSGRERREVRPGDPVEVADGLRLTITDARPPHSGQRARHSRRPVTTRPPVAPGGSSDAETAGGQDRNVDDYLL